MPLSLGKTFHLKGLTEFQAGVEREGALASNIL